MRPVEPVPLLVPTMSVLALNIAEPRRRDWVLGLGLALLLHLALLTLLFAREQAEPEPAPTTIRPLRLEIADDLAPRPTVPRTGSNQSATTPEEAPAGSVTAGRAAANARIADPTGARTRSDAVVARRAGTVPGATPRRATAPDDASAAAPASERVAAGVVEAPSNARANTLGRVGPPADTAAAPPSLAPGGPSAPVGVEAAPSIEAAARDTQAAAAPAEPDARDPAAIASAPPSVTPDAETAARPTQDVQVAALPPAEARARSTPDANVAASTSRTAAPASGDELPPAATRTEATARPTENARVVALPTEVKAPGQPSAPNAGAAAPPTSRAAIPRTNAAARPTEDARVAALPAEARTRSASAPAANVAVAPTLRAAVGNAPSSLASSPGAVAQPTAVDAPVAAAPAGAEARSGDRSSTLTEIARRDAAPALPTAGAAAPAAVPTTNDVGIGALALANPADQGTAAPIRAREAAGAVAAADAVAPSLPAGRTVTAARAGDAAPAPVRDAAVSSASASGIADAIEAGLPAGAAVAQGAAAATRGPPLVVATPNESGRGAANARPTITDTLVAATLPGVDHPAVAARATAPAVGLATSPVSSAVGAASIPVTTSAYRSGTDPAVDAAACRPGQTGWPNCLAAWAPAAVALIPLKTITLSSAGGGTLRLRLPPEVGGYLRVDRIGADGHVRTVAQREVAANGDETSLTLGRALGRDVLMVNLTRDPLMEDGAVNRPIAAYLVDLAAALGGQPRTAPVRRAVLFVP